MAYYLLDKKIERFKMSSKKLWKEFIGKFSDHLTTDNVKKMSWNFEIPDGKQENMTSLQMLQYLDHQKEITRDDISLLYDGIEYARRLDLKTMLDDFQASMRVALVEENKQRGGRPRPKSDYDNCDYDSLNQGMYSNSANSIATYASPRQAAASFNSDDNYPMVHEPRGYCLIINNTFNKDNSTITPDGKILGFRDGSDKDKVSLENLFKWLKFNVKSYDKVSRQYMETLLQLYSDDDKNMSHDCFVCCILSHGYEKGFYCNDGIGMDFSDMWEFFMGDKCPQLVGKPKLFFIQACQGERKATGVMYRDSPLIPNATTHPVQEESREFGTEEGIVERPPGSGAPPPLIYSRDADFSSFVATTPGTTAWRDSVAGSWFIQELIEVFKKHAETEALATLRQKINRGIARKAALVKAGEVAKMMSDGGLLTLTKAVYFNPGQSYEAWCHPF
eukprot:TCONS_00018475-protein